MKKIPLFLAVAFCIFPHDSWAGRGCYDARQTEAEQGIRIHSELMVISLNCMHMPTSTGNSLYTEYKKFTSQHETLFAKYEQILIDYMGKNGIKNTERAMHTLRTEFANKISGDAAKMRPDIFCKTYVPRIERASKMSNEELRKWAATPFVDHPVSKPSCHM